METLEDEEQSTATKVSFPDETIEDILSGLPVKSILRFRTLSKPWLSRISNPSFATLHFTRPHRTALFISAMDYSEDKQYFFSAALEGGPLTHIITQDDVCASNITEAQHLNGLVFFNCMDCVQNGRYNFVVNPSTHKVIKVPYPYPNEFLRGQTIEQVNIHHLFGFDEFTNEHKILSFGFIDNPYRVQVMVFSLSNYSWRKIDAVPPAGFCTDYNLSVCVNSVVHLMFAKSLDILAFDLTTEKFSVINTLQAVWPHDDSLEIYPSLIKINGCLGAVSHGLAIEDDKIHIFILQDYVNHVWIKETITFPEPWINDFSIPLDSVNMDEIIFSSTKLSGNVMSVPVYNRKSRCFKSLQFTLDHQFLLSRPPWLTSTTLEFDQIKCYVESMVPL